MKQEGLYFFQRQGDCFQTNRQVKGLIMRRIALMGKDEHIQKLVNENGFERKAMWLGSVVIDSDVFTVFLDPAGHPFCIIPIPEELASQKNGD
jgi:hypothetical protein